MEITIYSTTTCSYCHALRAWLDKQSIPYVYKLTDEDDAAMREFMSLNDGFLSVPFTVIETKDGKLTKITGFDQSKFRQALTLAQ
jgi:glutaredoxin 3